MQYMKDFDYKLIITDIKKDIGPCEYCKDSEEY